MCEYRGGDHESIHCQRYCELCGGACALGLWRSAEAPAPAPEDNGTIEQEILDRIDALGLDSSTAVIEDNRIGVEGDILLYKDKLLAGEYGETEVTAPDLELHGCRSLPGRGRLPLREHALSGQLKLRARAESRSEPSDRIG